MVINKTCCALAIGVAVFGLRLQADDSPDADGSARGASLSGVLFGYTRAHGGAPLSEAKVNLHSVERNTDRTVVSGNDGAFAIGNIAPGRYQLTASKDGLASTPLTAVELGAGQNVRLDLTLETAAATSNWASGRFFSPQRFFKTDSEILRERQAMARRGKYRGYP